MNSFLLVEMNNNNSFICRTNLTILNSSFVNIAFKLDTGCTYSTIPYHKLKNDDSICLKLKELDINSNIESMTSYGVESGGLQHVEPKTYEEKMACEALKFKHTISNFVLGDYELPDMSIFVNYNRHGNILIGMDILSKFDIHIGTSMITGKETLIAILKEQSNRAEYNNALREHFNIVEKSSILAKVFKEFVDRFK